MRFDQLIGVILPGRTKTRITARFMEWLLTEEVGRHFDAERFPEVAIALTYVASLYRREIDGGKVSEEEWQAGKEFARAASNIPGSSPDFWNDSVPRLAAAHAGVAAMCAADGSRQAIQSCVQAAHECAQTAALTIHQNGGDGKKYHENIDHAVLGRMRNKGRELMNEPRQGRAG